MKKIVVLFGLMVALAACSGPQAGNALPLSVVLNANSESQRAGLSVAFSALAGGAGSGALTYSWDFGDGKTASTTTGAVAHDYLVVGQYTATVTVSDGTRSATDTVRMNVLEPQYYGEWYWLASFVSGSYEGYFSVSLAVPDGEGFTGTSGGIWTWCDADGSHCDDVIGGGILGTLISSGTPNLIASFADSSNIKMIALDGDNRIGNEVEGQPTFLGMGSWYFTAGGEAGMDFGMVKVAARPVFAPQGDVSSLQGVQGQAAGQPELSGLGTAALDEAFLERFARGYRSR